MIANISHLEKYFSLSFISLYRLLMCARNAHDIHCSLPALKGFFCEGEQNRPYKNEWKFFKCHFQHICVHGIEFLFRVDTGEKKRQRENTSKKKPFTWLDFNELFYIRAMWRGTQWFLCYISNFFLFFHQIERQSCAMDEWIVWLNVVSVIICFYVHFSWCYFSLSPGSLLLQQQQHSTETRLKWENFFGLFSILGPRSEKWRVSKEETLNPWTHLRWKMTWILKMHCNRSFVFRKVHAVEARYRFISKHENVCMNLIFRTIIHTFYEIICKITFHSSFHSWCKSDSSHSHILSN